MKLTLSTMLWKAKALNPKKLLGYLNGNLVCYIEVNQDPCKKMSLKTSDDRLIKKDTSLSKLKQIAIDKYE